MTNPFDRRARTWDDDPRRGQLAADIFSALAHRVPLQPGWTALDYGCGTGLLTLALAPRVRRLTAVDSSRGMLDALARKTADQQIANVDLLLIDFASAPPPPGPFDLIASAMTLHHVADTGRLLRTFHAQLKPGGHLALADLDAEDGTFHSDPAGVHHAGFNRETLAGQLTAAGFDGIRFDTAARIEKNNRAYPVFLVTARKP